MREFPEFNAYVDTVEHRGAEMSVVVTPDHDGQRLWLAIDGDGLGIRIDLTPAAMRALGEAFKRAAENADLRRLGH